MSLSGKSKNNSETVCKLKESLYGLKRSPKCWYNKVDSFMTSHGFIKSQNDFCLYIKCFQNIKLYLLLYVDDLLLFGTVSQEVDEFKNVFIKNLI